METIEHFAQISLVARLLGGEHLLSREEVMRLQGLRGTLRHRGAGADLRRARRVGDQAECQIVPGAGRAGRQLVPATRLVAVDGRPRR